MSGCVCGGVGSGRTEAGGGGEAERQGPVVTVVAVVAADDERVRLVHSCLVVSGAVQRTTTESSVQPSIELRIRYGFVDECLFSEYASHIIFSYNIWLKYSYIKSILITEHILNDLLSVVGMGPATRQIYF